MHAILLDVLLVVILDRLRTHVRMYDDVMHHTRASSSPSSRCVVCNVSWFWLFVLRSSSNGSIDLRSLRVLEILIENGVDAITSSVNRAVCALYDTQTYHYHNMCSKVPRALARTLRERNMLDTRDRRVFGCVRWWHARPLVRLKLFVLLCAI